VTTSQATNASAQQKVQAFANAQARAQQTGQQVRVRDVRRRGLSSLANDAARRAGCP